MQKKFTFDSDKIISMKILSRDTQVLPYQVSIKFSKTFATGTTLGKSQAAKGKKCRREGIGMERKESYWFCSRTFLNGHLWTEKKWPLLERFK